MELMSHRRECESCEGKPSFIQYGTGAAGISTFFRDVRTLRKVSHGGFRAEHRSGTLADPRAIRVVYR